MAPKTVNRGQWLVVMRRVSRNSANGLCLMLAASASLQFGLGTEGIPGNSAENAKIGIQVVPVLPGNSIPAI